MASFGLEKKTKIPPPEQLLKPLSPHPKFLFGPGPSNPNARIYNASSLPMLGHFQTEFHHILDEVQAGLRYAFQTNNTYTIVYTGAGHTGIEGSMMNIVERGQRILICVNGMWGMRAKNIAERQGKSLTNYCNQQRVMGLFYHLFCATPLIVFNSYSKTPQTNLNLFYFAQEIFII